MQLLSWLLSLASAASPMIRTVIIVVVMHALDLRCDHEVLLTIVLSYVASVIMICLKKGPVTGGPSSSAYPDHHACNNKNKELHTNDNTTSSST